jgi:mono/diheme cytochrome c family protein
MRRLVLLGVLGWILTACQPTSSSVNLANNGNNPEGIFPIVADFMDLQAEGGFPKDSLVTIGYDHFFKKSKRYQVVPLRDLLIPLLKAVKDTANLRISFVCVDGYAPDMLLSKVLANEAYVALRDADLPADKNWPDSLRKVFEPFYLVWQNIPPEDESFAWPYGFFGIKITTFQDAFKEAYPKYNQAAQKGFAVFQLHCMKCHGVNKIGGVMGPEFNYPKNITEYWKKEDIWHFLQNPQSYRYSSKMPAQSTLKREEFEEIYTYLNFMKGQKLKSKE